MADTSNDRYNMHKACAECGDCCMLTVIAMMHDEVIRIQDYMREHGIVARDQGPGICPLRDDNMRCTVYPVRAKTCRLHHCKIPRHVIAATHPELDIPDDVPLIDMRRAFIYDDLRDPRSLTPDRIVAYYSG